MRASSSMHKTGQACDVCGAIGEATDLATCSNCRSSHEHVYCMRINLLEVPKIWWCEACQSQRNLISPKYPGQILPERQKTWDTGNGSSKGSSICNTTGKPAAHPVHRSASNKVKTAKVNYLPPEDYYELSSGAKPKASLQNLFTSQTDSFKTNHGLGSKKTPLPMTAFFKLSCEKDHHRFHGHPKPPSIPIAMTGTVQPPAISTGQTKTNLKRHLEPPTTTTQTKTDLEQQAVPLHVLRSQVHFPSKSSTSECSRKVEALRTKVMRQSVPEVHHSPSNRIGGVVHGAKEKCVVEKTLSGTFKCAGNVIPSKEYACKKEPEDTVTCLDKNTTSNSKTSFRFGEEDLPNSPAIKSTWKGSFEILGTTYGTFYAHPPERSSREACQVSQQMDAMLKFKLVPRLDVWPQIFNIGPPCSDDIALFFCAFNSYRCKEEYIDLLNMIEERDSSLQTFLAGAELLIFSSRHLSVESQRLNKQFYLWGVFRSLKSRLCSGSLNKSQHQIQAGSCKSENDGPLPNISEDQRGDLDTPPGFERPIYLPRVPRPDSCKSSIGNSQDSTSSDIPPGFASRDK
ncbi:hypothetical protein IFM89_004667 [Coptis chinensis]|uniref:Zinc finger PHD-type domain-containing protein n=1 Tax=Coptis chinensis TaxID=261450 RepID=A0A835I9U9_9MAGN|nr:hypothetical protein IFM89_004667 [Coptis chinensis]